MRDRCIRVGGKFTKKLIFTKDYPDGALIMRQFPRELVKKVKKLDFAIIKKITKTYLSGKEIRAVVARKELILQEINLIIKQFGRDNVLY